jgi:hypothetical protein
MKLKDNLEEAQHQSEAFIRHLNEASNEVASWEPWERGLLGNKQNASSDTSNHTARDCPTRDEGKSSQD